jgi:hypothetical protein
MIHLTMCKYILQTENVTAVLVFLHMDWWLTRICTINRYEQAGYPNDAAVHITCKCNLHILFLASTHSLQSINRTHKTLSIFCLDVLHKDINTLTQASVEQMPQYSSFVFYTKFPIYWHIHCHGKLTEYINWQCSVMNYDTIYDSLFCWKFIFTQVQAQTLVFCM